MGTLGRPGLLAGRVGCGRATFAAHARSKRLLQEAQRLQDERERMQKDLARAVTHPATHHTAAASGSN